MEYLQTMVEEEATSHRAVEEKKEFTVQVLHCLIVRIKNVIACWAEAENSFPVDGSQNCRSNDALMHTTNTTLRHQDPKIFHS